MADQGNLRRLERSIRRRLDINAALNRAWLSVPAITQIVVAASISYAIAHYLLGHEFPVVAVTVTISTLGISVDARPRRVLESVVGILTGIILSEVLRALVGQGMWQITVVLFVTLLTARLFSASNTFAIAAAVQSMLVMLLPAPDGGVFVRSIDGLVGGVLALVVTALIPRDPRRIARRDSRNLVSTLTESIDTLVGAVERADEPAASLALERLRRTQSLIDSGNTSLDTAISIARISPFLRRHLPELRQQARLHTGLDLASRHLRLIARRIDFLVRDGVPRPQLAAILAGLSAGITSLGLSTDDPGKRDAAREQLAALAGELDPSHAVPEKALRDSVIIHQLRPLVVDLLVATGLPVDEARAHLPQL